MDKNNQSDLWEFWNRDIKISCEQSNTFCIAVFSSNGELLSANVGMKKLFLDTPKESFINPEFDTIAGIVSDTPLIFDGYITLGSRYSSKNISIRAKILRRGSQLLIAGEIDVDQLTSVNEKLIELNNEVNDLQRKLIKEKLELTHALEQLRESQKSVIDSEAKIRGMLSEKELLLKEVHHRIKNNMITINGLLSIQASTLEEPAAVAALNDAGSRVNSMMLLYDKLYQSSGFNEISVVNYLPPLVDEILANFPNSGSVKIEKRIYDFVLNVKKMQPLGIIINELLTNIMKYAFAGRMNGSITVSADLKGDRAFIIIEDNGTGMPLSVDFEHSTGFGMQLVGMLTEQIGGTIRIERGDGTKFVLEFDV